MKPFLSVYRLTIRVLFIHSLRQQSRKIVVLESIRVTLENQTSLSYLRHKPLRAIPHCDYYFPSFQNRRWSWFIVAVTDSNLGKNDSSLRHGPREGAVHNSSYTTIATIIFRVFRTDVDISSYSQSLVPTYGGAVHNSSYTTKTGARQLHRPQWPKCLAKPASGP